MGMLGRYEAHFYCDCCNDFMEVGEYETRSETVKNVKKFWLLRKDGVVLCEKCKEIENLTLIPEYSREGGAWNWKTHLKAQEPAND
ncbi:hypothetical protein [Acinetobacter sp. YH12120]|uniref:hypothetical protein n=1 Tax=Acinetobacter sp. YH12120 TaxID=2601107 RepID=UPI0015D374C3|nr:hypothetical protein [Acinetobacter sp. YH12120]